MTGIGDVDSAGIATQIFDMSRMVRDSPELDAEFDRELDGLLDASPSRDRPMPSDCSPPSTTFMYEHGSRGPNEWDIYQPSYETKPTMLLQAIEATRQADDDADPARDGRGGAPSDSD